MKNLNAPVIDLDAIADPVAGTITIRGKDYRVLQATPATVKLMQRATPEGWLDVAITAVVRAVPDLEDEVFGTLSAAQMQAIIALSSGQLELVAQSDPNGESPATAPTSSPG